jgi:diguanylate cyclase (GGDEF)-like protein
MGDVFHVAQDNAISDMHEFIIQTAIFAASILTILIVAIACVFSVLRRNIHSLEKAHNDLSLFYDATPGCIVRSMYDGENWILTSANAEFYNFIGYSKTEFEEKYRNKIMEMIAAPLLKSITSEAKRQLSANEKLEMKIPIVCANGILKWILLRGRYVENQRGKEELFCVFLDITTGEELNKELFVSKEQLNIFRDMPEIIFFEWDINTKVISNSSNFSMIFDVPNTYENFPYSAKNHNFVHPDDFKGFVRSFEEMKNGRNHLVFECRLIHKDGTCVWYKSSLRTIFDYNAVPIKVVGVLSNIDDEKRKIEVAEESAKRDPLTQLYNKMTTNVLVQKYITSTKNNGAFFMLDIDNFKGINDTLGHIYGDAVLSEIAHALRILFRESDIVGRIGGDEFVVFMTNLHSREIIYKKAKEVLKALRRSFCSGDLSYNISCSIGISIYPDHGNNIDTLMEKADRALYYAKNHGKDQFVFYSASVEAESVISLENITITDTQSVMPQKNFRENMAEYILKLFHEFDNVDIAVPVLLDFVGKAFNIGRIDVSIFTEDEKYYNSLYEWCNEGVESVKELGVMNPADEWSAIKKVLDADNILCYENVSDKLMGCFENDDMEERGVKSVMLCYVLEKGVRKAVLAFEYFKETHHFTIEEKNAMKTVSNTISIFILRAMERQMSINATAQKKNREALLDESDEIVYVCDPETYELYYVNRAGREVFGTANTDYLGQKCYKFIGGCNSPCRHCTNHLLTNDKFYIWEYTDPQMRHHYLLKDKLIEWDGKQARIEWAIDLTEKENYTNALSARLKVKNVLLEGVEAMISASSLDGAMKVVLMKIGELYRADRSYILEMDSHNETINMTYEWTAEGVSAQINKMRNFPLKSSPVWNEAFNKRKPIFMEDINELKKDFPKEYERMKIQDIISMYAVPFSISGEFCGFLGIDSPREYKGDIDVLESISYFVSDEIFKRRTLKKTARRVHKLQN